MKHEPISEQVDLRSLIEAPLADPAKINVPFGKRPALRGQRPSYHDGLDIPKLKGSEVQARRVEAFSKKLCAVLDYYAGTSVPIERVAEHTNLTVEQVTAAMARRGREI